MSVLNIGDAPREVVPDHEVPDDVTGDAGTITAGTRSPVNPMPKQLRREAEAAEASEEGQVDEATEDADEPTMLEKIITVVCGIVVFIFAAIGFMYVFFGDHDSARKGEVIRVTMPQRPDTVYRSVPSGGFYDSSTPTSVDDVCNTTEGGSLDNQLVLVDPSGTCYVGAQIQAHLEEVARIKQQELKQLNAASAALKQLAATRGVKANDSWRELALEFAKTSKLPQAEQAAVKVYVAHGGNADEMNAELYNLDGSKKYAPKPPTAPPSKHVPNCLVTGAERTNGTTTWTYDSPPGYNQCKMVPPDES